MKLGLIVFSVSFSFVAAQWIAHGLDHIEKLSQLTASQRNTINELSARTQKMAESHRQAHERALNKTIQSQINMALSKAETLNCHPTVLQEVRLLAEETVKDWNNCLNIVEPIRDLIWFGVNLTSQIESDENVICSGIKNVTLCKNDTFFQEFECVSGALGTLTEIYLQNSKGVFYWLHRLDIIVEEFGQKIAQCINIIHETFFTNLDTKFDHRCSKNSDCPTK